MRDSSLRLIRSYALITAPGFINRVVLPIMVYQLTGSAFSMALSYVAIFVPFSLVSAFGGGVADRCSGRSLISAIALLEATLYSLLIFNFIFFRCAEIVYFCLVASSLAMPLLYPATIAMLKRSRENSSAESDRSIQQITLIDQSFLLAVPAFAGLAISLFGIVPVLVLMIILHILGAFSALQLSPDFSDEKLLGKVRRSSDIFAGARFVASDCVLVYGMALFLAMNFASASFQSISVFYFSEVLGLDARMIGLFFSISGLAGILGTLVSRKLPEFENMALLLVAFGLASSFLASFLVFQNSFYFLLVVWFLLSFISSIVSFRYNTYRHRATPSEIVGAVTSFTRVATFASIPLAALVSGLLIENVRSEIFFAISATVRLIPATVVAVHYLHRRRKPRDGE